MVLRSPFPSPGPPAVEQGTHLMTRTRLLSAGLLLLLVSPSGAQPTFPTPPKEYDAVLRYQLPSARNQRLVLDVLATSLGRYLHNVHTFHGITKPANYVPGFSDDLKSAMKTPPDPGPKPYAIVVPIRKDADWWNLPQAARLEMMQEHAQVTTPYLKTVKRKLYHASGLDDLDFITYFETARLDDFHNLILALERIKENRHNRRFGHPILLGTVCTVEDLAEVLAR